MNHRLKSPALLAGPSTRPAAGTQARTRCCLPCPAATRTPRSSTTTRPTLSRWVPGSSVSRARTACRKAHLDALAKLALPTSGP